MTIDDTIVAISSPPGAGERGIVRLSGPGAVEILSQVFHTDSRHDFSGGSRSVRCDGALGIGGENVAAAAIVFPDGKSYTGQSLVEIHLPGAPTILGMVVEICLEAGARRAEAGEFTARAFMSGRLDLSQAHGVAGMIAAQTDQQLRAAERLLHGQLGEVALAVREDLADLISLVEGAMDFADEPIEFIDVPTLQTRLRSIRDQLAQTAGAGLRAERWGQLPRVVLAGRPNAGKSSLLNRLCGMDRAINTPIAGTTRDVLSAVVSLGDRECLIMDVAGVMDLRGDSENSIDAQAMRMAAAAAAAADVLLIVIDLAADASLENLTECWQSSDALHVLVGNKSDLATDMQIAEFRRWCSTNAQFNGVVVSAMTGDGCEVLGAEVIRLLTGRGESGADATIALMAEHREALLHALQAMDRAIELAESCDSQLNDADLAATELRIAAAALGMLVGMDQTEDMLGRVFSRFCVGK